MAESLSMEKNTKYLLWLIVLVFGVAIILTIQGLIEPQRPRLDMPSAKPPVVINEDLLDSPALDDLREFQSIDYPSAQMGRRDLFSWPEPAAEDRR